MCALCVPIFQVKGKTLKRKYSTVEPVGGGWSAWLRTGELTKEHRALRLYREKRQQACMANPRRIKWQTISASRYLFFSGCSHTRLAACLYGALFILFKTIGKTNRGKWNIWEKEKKNFKASGLKSDTEADIETMSGFTWHRVLPLIYFLKYSTGKKSGWRKRGGVLPPYFNTLVLYARFQMSQQSLLNWTRRQTCLHQLLGINHTPSSSSSSSFPPWIFICITELPSFKSLPICFFPYIFLL